MGMQDRDYYKEWWNKRDGYVEKAKFRLPAYRSKLSGEILAEKPLPVERSQDWHWSLQVLLAIFISLCTFGFFKLLKIFTG